MVSRINDDPTKASSVKLKAMTKYFWFPLIVISFALVNNTNPVMCNKATKVPNNKIMTRFIIIVCLFPTCKFVGLDIYQDKFSIWTFFLSNSIFQCNTLYPC